MAGGAAVDLGDLVVGAGEADAESFDLTEPGFAFGLGDAGVQVVADLDQAGPLFRVGPEHRATDAGVFVDARGAERAGAGAGGDLAPFEVAEELLPLLVGGSAVLLAGAQGPPSCQER